MELRYTVQVNQGTSVRQINDILLAMKRFPFVINANLQAGDEMAVSEKDLIPTGIKHAANNDINCIPREFAED